MAHIGMQEINFFDNNDTDDVEEGDGKEHVIETGLGNKKFLNNLNSSFAWNNY